MKRPKPATSNLRTPEGGDRPEGRTIAELDAERPHPLTEPVRDRTAFADLYDRYTRIARVRIALRRTGFMTWSEPNAVTWRGRSFVLTTAGSNSARAVYTEVSPQAIADIPGQETPT